MKTIKEYAPLIVSIVMIVLITYIVMYSGII